MATPTNASWGWPTLPRELRNKIYHQIGNNLTPMQFSAFARLLDEHRREVLAVVGKERADHSDRWLMLHPIMQLNHTIRAEVFAELRTFHWLFPYSDTRHAPKLCDLQVVHTLHNFEDFVGNGPYGDTLEYMSWSTAMHGTTTLTLVVEFDEAALRKVLANRDTVTWEMYETGLYLWTYVRYVTASGKELDWEYAMFEGASAARAVAEYRRVMASEKVGERGGWGRARVCMIGLFLSFVVGCLAWMV